MSGETLRNLAQEIAGYISNRPDAADTLEGLTLWWISRQRLLEAEKNVRQAVEYLIDQGVIEKRAMADGRVLYRATPKK